MRLSGKESRTITRNVLSGVLAGSVALYAVPVYAGSSDEHSPVQTVINQVTDLSADWLSADTVEVKEDGDKVDVNVVGGTSSRDFQLFANAGYGHLTHDIDGGEVKTNSWGMDLGMAKTVDYDNGSHLTFAPVIDYGHGTYDSYSDQYGKLGHGKSTYFAGGVMARQTLKNGFYYEGSLRYGRTKLDFTPTGGTSYDASAPVWAGHIHLGRRVKVDPQSILNVYGMYHHTHQNSMSIPAIGCRVDAANSGRLRVGAKVTRYASKTQSFYSGLAYQYEHSSGADVNYGIGVAEGKSVHGSSGMLELGWQVRQSARSSWALDVNVTGWAGMQHGVTTGVKYKKSF